MDHAAAKASVVLLTLAGSYSNHCTESDNLRVVVEREVSISAAHFPGAHFLRVFKLGGQTFKFGISHFKVGNVGNAGRARSAGENRAERAREARERSEAPPSRRPRDFLAIIIMKTRFS